MHAFQNHRNTVVFLKFLRKKVESKKEKAQKDAERNQKKYEERTRKEREKEKKQIRKVERKYLGGHKADSETAIPTVRAIPSS